MTEKEIIVTETIGIPRFGEYVRVGVPFAKGELFRMEKASMLSPAMEEQPVQVTPLNYWSDGSIKWMLLDFAATVSSMGQVVYRFMSDGKGEIHFPPGIRMVPGNDSWLVDTGVAVFLLDAKEFRPFTRVTRTHGRIATTEGDCILVTADNDRMTPRVESIVVETEGPLRAILAIRGRFVGTGQEFCKFSSRLHFFARTSCVCLEFTIHNPSRAQHPGGFWDLGDTGSILLRELAFEFNFPPDHVTDIQCYPESGAAPIQPPHPEVGLSLYQESSGGKNWLSPVHRNRNGNVPFNIRGYEVRLGNKQVSTGKRATPVIWCGFQGSGVSAVLPRFWQEFPKAVAANSHGLKIGLFPGRYPDFHELQGGEQKTHRVYLDFSSPPNDLAWARLPLSAVAGLADICRSRALFELPSSKDASREHDLTDLFIPGPGEFLRKRETTDEYGWRNFGDIYADHEGVYHKGNQFVSHYNNQYDICAGMYRKYMMSGDPLWAELASDLARHVRDIDIYHTDQDRDEYNHGLFWHTDHYTPAGLSTHRSFSREQIGDRDPASCGGGPGAEHCYTTGLMLAYFLTGDPGFREAVICLADWSYHSMNGSGTVLATIRAASRYFSQLRGVGRGNRKVFPRYPLTRGTGNAITASLDAYEITGDEKFLQRAGELLRGSIHPHDDLDARNLLDAERAWSYTVLLSSIAKYLVKSEEREDFGAEYSYAKASFLAYAAWMVRYEYPYLDQPEILEYPNETWPAQDLRKSVILYHAARYSEGERRKTYLDRALFFYEKARQELTRHSTSRFTRPLALIFQNGWIGQRLQGEELPESKSLPVASSFGDPTPYLSAGAVMARIAGELTRSLRRSSLSREVTWLTSRLSRL